MSSESAPPATGQPTLNPGPKPRRNTRNKDKAESMINGDAKPISISNLFGGFRSDVRGGIEIELDVTMPERYSSAVLPAVINNPDINFMFTGTSDPVMEAHHQISCGLNLSAALKLLHSTPSSQQSDIGDFYRFSETTVEVPTSYLEILALLGKTDFGDTEIRIQDNGTTIRRLFLKAILHACRSDTFQGSEQAFSEPFSGRIDKINDTLTIDKVNQVMFDDYSTIRLLQKNAVEELDKLMKIPFSYTHPDGNTYSASPPYLPSGQTLETVLNWMNALPPECDRVPLASLALCSVFKASWLKRMTDTFGTIDLKFIGTPAENVTPFEVLTTVNVFYIGALFPGNFVQAIHDVVCWYQKEAFNLTRLLMLKDTGKSSFGHPAQCVYLDDNETKTLSSLWATTDESRSLAIKIPKSATSMVYSGRKITNPSQVLTAASFMITKAVHFKEKYRGFTTMALPEICSKIVSRSFIRKKLN